MKLTRMVVGSWEGRAHALGGGWRSSLYTQTQLRTICVIRLISCDAPTTQPRLFGEDCGHALPHPLQVGQRCRCRGRDGFFRCATVMCGILDRYPPTRLPGTRCPLVISVLSVPRRDKCSVTQPPCWHFNGDPYNRMHPWYSNQGASFRRFHNAGLDCLAHFRLFQCRRTCLAQSRLGFAFYGSIFFRSHWSHLANLCLDGMPGKRRRLV